VNKSLGKTTFNNMFIVGPSSCDLVANWSTCSEDSPGSNPGGQGTSLEKTKILCLK
jgi:hypothetical protein